MRRIPLSDQNQGGPNIASTSEPSAALTIGRVAVSSRPSRLSVLAAAGAVIAGTDEQVQLYHPTISKVINTDLWVQDLL